MLIIKVRRDKINSDIMNKIFEQKLFIFFQLEKYKKKNMNISYLFKKYI